MSEKKYFFFFIVLFISAVILAGKVKQDDPEMAEADMHKYIEMAESSPQINESVRSPFVYRIGAPFIAGLLPFPIPVSFYLLNIAALFFLSYVFLKLLILYGIDHKKALLLTGTFMFNRYFFQFLAWDYFQLSDTLSYALLFLSLILIKKNKLLMFSVVVTICMIVREVAFLALPFGMVFYLKDHKTGSLLKFLIGFVPAVLIFFIIRQTIDPQTELSILSAFKDGAAKFLTPAGIIKTLAIPFAPFVFLPVWFWRETIQFIKKHPVEITLFVFTVVSTLFGSDTERLMTPAAPAIFLLFGKILMKKQNDKLYISLLLLAFLHSFYHLWGIVQLPNEKYSIISTGMISIIVIAAVIFSGKWVNNKND